MNKPLSEMVDYDALRAEFDRLEEADEDIERRDEIAEMILNEE